MPVDAAMPPVGPMRPTRRERLSQIGWIVFTLLILGVAAYALDRQLAEVSWDGLRAEIFARSWVALALAVLATAASFAMLTLYDRAAFAYIGIRLPYWVQALGGTCGFAIGNTAGASPITGGSTRFRIYGPHGVSVTDVARVTMFAILSFGIGVHLIGAGTVLIDPHTFDAAFGFDATSTRIVAAVVFFGILVIGTVWIRSGWAVPFGRLRLSPPSGRLALAQLVVTLIDITCAGLCLYVLLPDGAVGFVPFMTIYTIAVAAGVASHVPAGAGVFESLMIAGIGSQVGLESLAAALVLYRVVYHALPIVVAVAILVALAILRDPGVRASAVVPSPGSVPTGPT